MGGCEFSFLCLILILFAEDSVLPLVLEVICQRQIQKGSLAALAVDSVEKSKYSASKLSREELDDCFSLKESCRCDTHLKVGDWPDYSGEESLKSQGCSDLALLSIAAMNETECPLVFVHSVKEDAETTEVENETKADKEVVCDESDEEIEWKSDDAHSRADDASEEDLK